MLFVLSQFLHRRVSPRCRRVALGQCRIALGQCRIALGQCRVTRTRRTFSFCDFLPPAADVIPEAIVGGHLLLAVGGLPHDLQRLPRLRIVEKVLRHLVRAVAVDFGQEAKPQDLHFLLCKVLRLELRKLHEDKVQTVQHLVGVEIVDHPVIVVVLVQSRLERVVD